MFSASTLFWALIGGIIPAVLWLIFWLCEDKKNPEPRGLIINVFLAGMAAVFVALVFEKSASYFVLAGSTFSIVLWSVIEEISKWSAAYFFALRRKENDEPVDSMVYLITAALGFAALENTFFLLTPLGEGNIIGSLVTGNLRFVGSTLLHVTTSGIIGIFTAYAFCELKIRKQILVGIGLILAVVLHAFFNFFILKGNNNLFIIFGFVWVGVIILILFFERIKRIDRTCITSTIIKNDEQR